MRVLIVNRYMSMYGGAETVVKELALNLKALNIENLIITLNISEETRKICQGLDMALPKKHFPYKFRSTDFFSSIGIIEEARHLRRLVEKYAPGFDVINVHNFPAEWVTGGLGKPVVWMCNEIPDFYNNTRLSLTLKFLRRAGISWDKWIVKRGIDAICVADEFNAERVKKRYNRDSFIIPYGIDFQMFNFLRSYREEISAQYNLSHDEFILLQVGVLSPQKNQIASLKALRKLLENKIDAKLILVGRSDTPYKQILDKYILENELSGRVIFTGHLSKNIAVRFYGIAGICLFPVKEQGGWLAPFEALLCARPVIVSSTMGAAALIKKYNFGIISEDFSSAISDFLLHQQAWKDRAKEAAEWIKENLTWRNFTAKMVEVFEKTISGGAKA